MPAPACADQTLPSHFRILPALPTAQTLLALVPQMPKRVLRVSSVCPVQAVPFHFRMPPPTAQMLFASLPHRAASRRVESAS